jgi:exodeoxyribonuclease-5
MFILTEEQKLAIRAIRRWFKSSKQEFFLAGYAGTGKSTLVNFILEDLGINLSRVALCTYTGKASLVLTQKSKGKYHATTIHSLIYDVRINQLTGLFEFTLKDREALEDIDLILIDEASTVDDDIYADLRSFDIKLLFIGDHGQLPPVGKGTLVAQRIFGKPDIKLSTVHRQAADNPIIHLSMLARERRLISPGTYGDKVLVSKPKPEILHRAYQLTDQVIVGTNNSRTKINKWHRDRLGFTGAFPELGDKLICLKNNKYRTIKTTEYDISLVNGMIGYVTSITNAVGREFTWPALDINFKPEFTDHQFEHVYVPEAYFLGQNIFLNPREYKLYDSFTFGYAITCHKAMGSQWNKLLVIDESYVFGEHAHRWLYTAITRAEDYLMLFI